MGKYQAYPEYKNTGVLGLEEIPVDWELKRIKFLFDIGRGRVISEQELVDEGLYPVYSSQTKNNGCLGYINTYDFDCEQITWTTDGANAGTVFLRKGKHNCTNVCGTLRPRREDETMGFTLYCLEYVTPFHKRPDTNGAKIMNNEMAEISISHPPFLDREKIASFLDHETAKIDTLIDKQQQLIQLLKEKRQAVISHAVTKGLNPNAPMRDSGVEWLGEVPEHWQVRRLKHTSKLQSGIPKGKDLTGKLSISVPMLRVANVQDGFLDLEDVHMMKIEPEQLTRFSLQKGDVLMNEGGDNDKLGRGAVWQGEIEPCIHQNHVFAIRPYSIEPEWLDLITRASYAKFHFYRVAKQSTNLASISSTNIKETPLTVPPELERKEILTYVQGKLNSFESIEKKCVTQIKLLQERRTALISAAVTGKIDVRHHALRPAGNDTIG